MGDLGVWERDDKADDIKSIDREIDKLQNSSSLK